MSGSQSEHQDGTGAASEASTSVPRDATPSGRRRPGHGPSPTQFPVSETAVSQADGAA